MVRVAPWPVAKCIERRPSHSRRAPFPAVAKYIEKFGAEKLATMSADDISGKKTTKK